MADMSISIYRITLGFLISTVIALPVGILIGSYRGWEAAIEPFVDFIRYMPVVAFVPLTILWTGTGDAQKFLIIFIGTFFQQVLLVMDNVKSVPRDFIQLGRTLEMPEWRSVRNAYRMSDKNPCIGCQFSPVGTSLQASVLQK